MSEEKRSVFGKVDQESIIERLANAPDDDPDTMVDYERKPNANPAILAGIHAFADETDDPTEATPELTLRPEAPDSAAHLGRRSTPAHVVDYRGPLINDVSARRSFILHGPSGVNHVK